MAKEDRCKSYKWRRIKNVIQEFTVVNEDKIIAKVINGGGLKM